MNKKIGNYIDKIIGDYVIVDKKRVNNRMKYLVRCNVCKTEKWIFNCKELFHGSDCEGRHRKTGSKLIGTVYGDYIVLEKIVKNNRSAYIVKCKICNSVKTVWNLRKELHGEQCNNFINFILGEKFGDFIIKKARKLDRIYADVECLICGSKRNNIAYKDLKLIFSNKHSSICTIKNLSIYKNKKLVSKLLRTFQNMNTRIKKEPAYSDVKNNFLDSTDFVVYVYDMFNKRYVEENIQLDKLSIDRINPFGNYEKGNVRCLTLSEQQSNKKIHYKESVETIENSDCVE